MSDTNFPLDEEGAVTLFDTVVDAGVSSDDRDAWLTARRSGIGGSDVPAIMGVRPYRESPNALSVYADKTALVRPDDAGEAALWGHIFEKPILTEYARRTKRRLYGGGRLLRSKSVPYWLATLDAEQVLPTNTLLPDAPTIVDCKTTGDASRYAEDVPLEVQMQLQYYLLVTGAALATVVVMPFPERKLAHYDIRAHGPFQELLTRKLEEFWTRVVQRNPPSADGSPASAEALQRLYPEDNGEAAYVVGEAASKFADEWQFLQTLERQVDKRRRELKHALRESMKFLGYAVMPDGRYFTLKSVAERDELCPHCSGIVRSTSSYRGARLWPPKKGKRNPLPEPKSTLELTTPEMQQADELTRALEASVRKEAP